ncbi:hypothetical protein [Pseudomonas sp. 28 E 9]|uniref:hypothetical protein n=1 Tax=Pseudomonas sp. 28 E 9 TaxID=1844098 RepID=UPI000812BC23|nr:hypothetical protein [Pseudomonas sp. 28 E 9]CRM05341.1 hypothetical protein [Pseudomonas sp. 28 E 9]
MSEVKSFWCHEASNVLCVRASDFDNLTRLFLDAAERAVASERREKELQQRLTAADERADSFDRLYTSSLDERDQLQQRVDVLEAWCRKIMNSSETLLSTAHEEELFGLVEPADAGGYGLDDQPCCTVSPEDQALLDAGDYTPEELFGIGGKPSCPKCAKP